jgi:hypothetical protein
MGDVQLAGTTERAQSPTLAGDPALLDPSVVNERYASEPMGEKILVPAATEVDEAAVESTKRLRRSKRVVAVADMHTLHKVETMAAKNNLESKGISFTSYSDSQVLSNLGRIGINQGSSDVAVIKNLEVDRLVLCAKHKKLNPNATTIDFDDEQEERLEAVLNHACGDLNENVLDTENDHIIDLPPVCRKKKYNTAKNPKKGKLPKKPKTPSKINLK